MANEPEAMEIDQAEQEQEVEKKPKGKVVKKVEAKVGGKRFEIKKWNAVAMWSWAISTDTCAICRNNLYEPSIEYQVRPQQTWVKPWTLRSVYYIVTITMANPYTLYTNN